MAPEATPNPVMHGFLGGGNKTSLLFGIISKLNEHFFLYEPPHYMFTMFTLYVSRFGHVVVVAAVLLVDSTLTNFFQSATWHTV